MSVAPVSYPTSARTAIMSVDMKPIPVAKPYLGKEEENAVLGVIRSGNLTTGWKVRELEEMFADYMGCKYAVACNSATSGLQIAWEIECELAQWNIREVVLPSYSFIATANAVHGLNLDPDFRDIDLETYNLKPEIANLVEYQDSQDQPAFMPVHQMGLMFSRECIQEGIDRGAIVVEDAACAVGSWFKYGDMPMDHFAVFSFHPRKVITTGEGGILVTDNKEKAGRARELIDHAPGGYNYRLSDLQAAVGIEQMKKLPEILNRRHWVATTYNKILSSCNRIVLPMKSPNRQSYQVRLDWPGISAANRDTVLSKLHDKGVMATKGVQDIHRIPLYRQWSVDLPNSELAADTTIILPLYSSMDLWQVAYCAESLIKAVQEIKSDQ